MTLLFSTNEFALLDIGLSESQQNLQVFFRFFRNGRIFRRYARGTEINGIIRYTLFRIEIMGVSIVEPQMETEM